MQAPEFYMSFEDPIEASVDFWALGVTLFNLLMGRMPWGGELVNQVTADYHLPSSVSFEARHFIKECLTVSTHHNIYLLSYLLVNEQQEQQEQQFFEVQ